MANRTNLQSGGVYKVLAAKDGTSGKGPWQFLDLELPNEDPSKKPRSQKVWVANAPVPAGKDDIVKIDNIRVTFGWEQDKESKEWKQSTSFTVNAVPQALGQTNIGFHDATPADEAGLPF